MNIAAKIHEKKKSKSEARPLNKVQAKKLLGRHRKNGSWQSVGWLWDSNVIWLRNCDENCVAYRAPEVPRGGIPSFLVATVDRRSDGTGCWECAKWCKHRALSHAEDEKAVVDPGKCKDCCLCVENCSNSVLVFKLRQNNHDVGSKSIQTLGKGIVNLD
ncbi:MAG: hypothetical protein GY866_08015 [Proteobacteria bacterium]|nr:hypothetical protein [Pseudomonadota bacterium]